MSLERILTQINSYGFIVNNMLQLGPKGPWRCNTRSPGANACWNFHDGETALEAATKALADIEEKLGDLA